MDTVKIFLAAIFDFFKLRSPVIATTVLSILVIVAYNFNAIAADFNITNPTFLAAVKWANFVLIALTGSRTSQYLPSKAEDIEAQ